MSEAAVFTRLRVVRATPAASRKFHGTNASAMWARRDSTSRIWPSSQAVPAKTSSPAARSTARGSPVSAAWLIMAQPLSTVPSMGTGMPVRMAMRSPGASSVAGTARSSPPSTSCAVSGTESSE